MQYPAFASCDDRLLPLPAYSIRCYYARLSRAYTCCQTYESSLKQATLRRYDLRWLQHLEHNTPGSRMMDTKSRIPQSNIPVKVSRPAQSALPSSLPIPQLGLVPPSRHPSVGDTPTHQGPSSSGSSSGGGITPLRSFRSLLPFGSGSKNSISTNLSPGGSNKSSFTTFSAIRKSINGDRNGERSVSAPQLRASKSQEETPVFSIDAPRTIELSYKVNEPLISSEDLPQGLDLYESPKETSSPKSAPAQSRTFQVQCMCIV